MTANTPGFAELGLSTQLLETLRALGYRTPTAVQQQAIPAVLTGRDVLAVAQTGTGKTAAFALPILTVLAAAPENGETAGVRALVLVPTRELAAQVGESFERYGANLAISSYAAYGGVNLGPQLQRLRRGVDVLIATPGRLLDLIAKGAVDFAGLRTLVLDEADRMLDLGFAEALATIFQALPERRQTLLFSATFGPAVTALATRQLVKPVRIEATPPNTAAGKVKQWVVPVDKKRKGDLFLFMRRDRGWRHTLVFVKTRQGCDELVARLESKGIAADALHGDRPQAERQRVLDAFKTGTLEVLVATDVAARGIDIENLARVVNFDLPAKAEDYVHRIGRTGRAGQAGEAISFASADDAPLLAAIETLLKRPLSRDEEPGFEPRHQVPATLPGATRGAKPPAPQKAPGRGAAPKRPAPSSGAGGSVRKGTGTGSGTTSARGTAKPSAKAGRAGAHRAQTKPRGR